MEFASTEEIKAPIDEVFATLTDIDAVERQAIRRGVEVRRHGGRPGLEAGVGWHVVFKFRGRKRSSEITLSEVTPPHRLVFDSQTGGLETKFQVALTALSETRTQVETLAQLDPKTLSARLLVQSMKLAKSRIARKYAVRMAQFARDVEERAARQR